MTNWKKYLTKTMTVLSAVVGVGIGGLFISGAFLNAVILNWLPAIAHTVVGWALVIGTLLTGFLNLTK